MFEGLLKDFLINKRASELAGGEIYLRVLLCTVDCEIFTLVLFSLLCWEIKCANLNLQ